MSHATRGTRTLSTVAIGAVATLGMAACSTGNNAAGGTGNNATSNQSPERAVETAISKVGSQSSIELSLSLPITAAQAEQLEGSSGSGPTPAEAKALTTGRIFFTFATGGGEAIDSKQARTDHKNAFDIGLSFGNDTPLELRYVDQNLYLHAEVQKLLSDVGRPVSDAAKFDTTLQQLNSYVPGVGALAQGKWVELSHSSLQPLAAQLGQAESSVPGGGIKSAQFQTRILELRTQLLAAAQANSTVASLGTQNGRHEYAVTVDVSSMLNTVLPEIDSTLSSIPGFSSQASSAFAKARSAIPATKAAVIDLYVAHNQLSQADLDLNQFAKQKESFAVPLQLAISSPGAPPAPSGATNLDLSKLPSLLGGLIGSLGHSSTPAHTTPALGGSSA